MQRQQRPAAELMPVARLLGEERKFVVAYWLDRLKAMSISAERPLSRRLTVRDDGRLALDLSDTKVADLSPWPAPLAELSAAGASDLTSIAPLRGMKLTALNVARTKVVDLTPLRDMWTLEKLVLNGTRASDLSPLAGLRLRDVDITACPVHDLSPLRGAALESLTIGGHARDGPRAVIGHAAQTIGPKCGSGARLRRWRGCPWKSVTSPAAS